MKRQVMKSAVFKATLSAIFATSVGFALAADFTWTGAIDNDWSKGGNWGGTAPGNTDTAIFNKEATVTPPADFVGLIRVSGDKCLTVNVPSDRRFSLALGATNFADTGASFKKTGSGKLTLQAYAGINPGTVTIAEGPVAFAGNGDVAAGAFGKVILENGVVATIVESPLAKRHGYGYRIGKVISGTDSNAFYAQGDAAALQKRYDEIQYIDLEQSYEAGVRTVAENAVAFDAEASSIPIYKTFENKGGVIVYYRGLFLSEVTDQSAWQYAFHQGNSIAVRMNVDASVSSGWPASANPNINFSPNVRQGWNVFNFSGYADLRYWGTAYVGLRFSLTRTPTHDGDDGVMTGAKLWNGVAFTSLEVNEGASLTISDGQAMAIANARSFKMNGTFASASADTYLYLASDWSVEAADAPLSAKALRAFSGTVEVAPTARLGGDDATQPVGYRIVGSGEVTVTAANRDILTGWAGPLRVGEGVSYELQSEVAQSNLSDKAELTPVTASTWQLNENASFTNNGTAIRLVAPMATMNSRAAVIGKTAVPVYCPFEFSCDVYQGKRGSVAGGNVDANVGLFVQCKGTALDYNGNMWTSRIGYMLSNSEWMFGAMAQYYDRSILWTTNVLNKVSDPNNNTKNYVGNKLTGWDFTDDKPMHWSLSYDGKGTFKLRVQKNAAGDIVETSYAYPVLTDSKYAKTAWYPSILARVKDNTYQAIIVSNIAFKVLSSPATITRKITVEDDATLSIKGMEVDSSAGTPFWNFTNLTLADGATLAYAPHFSGFDSGVKVSNVKLSGAATVSATEGTVSVGDIEMLDGGAGLSVIGKAAVKEPLTITASRTELKKQPDIVTVLDLSTASPIPAIDVTKVKVINSEDGSDLTASKRAIVTYKDGKLGVNARFGMILIVK